MSRAPAIADERVLDALRKADHFTCTILSKNRYITHAYRTLTAARFVRRELEALASNGRKAMIYVVTTDGDTVFVPDFE